MAIEAKGIQVTNKSYFDTLTFTTAESLDDILARAADKEINLRIDNNADSSDKNKIQLGLSLNEITTAQDIQDLYYVITGDNATLHLATLDSQAAGNEVIESGLLRDTPILQHSVFNTHHSETEMLRFLKHLENKDLSLTNAMIPLGSCTMKLNATS